MLGFVRRLRHRCRLLGANVRDAARSARTVGFAARRQAESRWHSREFLEVFDDADPLVTVCIATYNRARLLTERTLPSVFAQTHSNIEIVVVGDACTDDTASRIAALRDPRLRFINLPVRGPYPDEPLHRWMVAGTFAMNRALEEANGAFITHLDDDDEHVPDRIEKLVDLLRTTRSDLAFHPFCAQQRNGSWWVNNATWFVKGYVTTSSVLYHRYWKRERWDVEAWRFNEPGDWNRFRRIRFLGARTARHPDTMLLHYREQSQTAP
jgi:glycosyltransferase involved in cell wall biosynthesis